MPSERSGPATAIGRRSCTATGTSFARHSPRRARCDQTNEKQVDVKENEPTNVGLITLSRAKAGLELATVPSGAKVFLNGSLIGTTPLRRDDLNPGEATYLLALEGHLPRQIKASLDPKQI